MSVSAGLYSAPSLLNSSACLSKASCVHSPAVSMCLALPRPTRWCGLGIHVRRLRSSPCPVDEAFRLAQRSCRGVSASADDSAIDFWVDGQRLIMRPLYKEHFRSSACWCESHSPDPTRSTCRPHCHPFQKEKSIRRAPTFKRLAIFPDDLGMAWPSTSTPPSRHILHRVGRNPRMCISRPWPWT